MIVIVFVRMIFINNEVYTALKSRCIFNALVFSLPSPAKLATDNEITENENETRASRVDKRWV